SSSLQVRSNRTVDGGAHLNNAISTITQTKYASRKIDTLPKAMRSIQAEFNGWYLTPGSTSLGTDCPNDMVLTNLYAACNGTVVHCTFGGAGIFNRTILAGEDMVRCDPLDAMSFGYPSDIFPEGTSIQWTTEFTQPTTGHKFMYTSGLGNNLQSVTWNPAVTTATLNSTGAITATGTALTNLGGGAGYIPMCVGVPVESDVQALVVRGNSQSQNHDSWIQQAATALNWPILNLAVSSSKIQAGLDDARVQRMYALGNQGVIQFGRNEFPAMSVATLQGYVVQDAVVMRTKGITRIGCDDVPPYTDSTDSWASAGNQTQHTGSGSGSNDDLFSQGITSISGIDYKTTRDSNRDAGDFFKWLTNGAGNYPTTDGKHATTALDTLKAAEVKSQIATAAQLAKADAEASVLFAEGRKYQIDVDAAQALINTASGAGANVARMQARLAAIVIVIPTFLDVMGAAYAANSDIPVANTGWTALSGYTAGCLQYLGNANGIKLIAGGAGAIRPTVQNGNSVQQVVNFTLKQANGGNGAVAPLMLDKDNWIGITGFGQSSLTQTVVSLCTVGTVTALATFTNFANATSSDVMMAQIRNIDGVYTLELFQNGHQLSTVSGSADVTAYVDPAGSGFLKAARYPGLVWRGGAQSAWLTLWSSTALA
ncbi:MAG: hypothetical protein ABI395_05140, partial [Sphingobium sp.]